MAHPSTLLHNCPEGGPLLGALRVIAPISGTEALPYPCFADSAKDVKAAAAGFEHLAAWARWRGEAHPLETLNHPQLVATLLRENREGLLLFVEADLRSWLDRLLHDVKIPEGEGSSAWFPSAALWSNPGLRLREVTEARAIALGQLAAFWERLIQVSAVPSTDWLCAGATTFTSVTSC